VRAGDERAFELIFDRYHRGLLAFCGRMLASSEEAEDALQHTFMAAYRALRSSDRPIHLKAWLYTIARNRCLSVLRARREQVALDHGVRPDQIIIDPGHDLNKNTLHSLELTRRLDEIAAVGYPMLAAVSNKDFIGETLDRDRDQRLAGSLAAAVFCATQGARLVRVHNVRESVDALRMVETILGWREPVYMLHNTRPEGND